MRSLCRFSSVWAASLSSISCLRRALAATSSVVLLPNLLFKGLLTSFLLFDIGRTAKPVHHFSVRVSYRDGSNQVPAIASIGAPEAYFDLMNFDRLQRVPPLFQAGREVLRIDRG